MESTAKNMKDWMFSAAQGQHYTAIQSTFASSDEEELFAYCWFMALSLYCLAFYGAILLNSIQGVYARKVILWLQL